MEGAHRILEKSVKVLTLEESRIYTWFQKTSLRKKDRIEQSLLKKKYE